MIDYVLRPVVLYRKFCTTQLMYKSAMPSETRSMPTITHSHHRVGTENSGLDSEMFPPIWRLAAWLIECSRIGCFVRGKTSQEVQYVCTCSQSGTVGGYFSFATPDASSIILASVMSVGKKKSRFPRRGERGLEGIRQKQY